MTGFNYDDHRIALDGKDSSKNTATDIQGYPLDIQLDPSWGPRLSADQNKVRADHHKMLEVAGEIDRMVEALQNSNDSGSPMRITTVSGQAKYGPETWFAAKSLKAASDQVAVTVSQYSQDLLTNLQAASNAIKQAAGTYHQADQANQQSAQNQIQNLDAGNQPQSFR